MKKILSAVFVLVLITVFAQFTLAGETDTKAKTAKKQSQKPGAIAVEVISVTAIVDAIDAEKRTVTLKLADGKTQIFKLGPEVKNFDQVKVGDQVKTTFAESVAVFVRKSNEKPFADETRTVQVAPKGAKPGIVMTDTFEITAKVEAIDYKKRTLTIKGPEGNLKAFSVDKGVTKFKSIKIGDEVVVRITDAVAIIVEKSVK